MTSVIYFDYSHGTVTPLKDRGDVGYTLLASELYKKGYRFKIITEGLEEFFSLPEEEKSLWITCPTRPFADEEADKLLRYVESGGRAIIFGEWGDIHSNVTYLNHLLQGFSSRFNKDRVVDYDLAYVKEIKLLGEVMEKKKVPEFVRILDFQEHSAVEGVKEAVFFSGCSLDVTEDENTMVLAWTGAESFADENENLLWDEGEAFGSLPVIALEKKGKGELILVGDTSFATNKYIDTAENKKLAMSLLSYIAGK